MVQGTLELRRWARRNKYEKKKPGSAGLFRFFSAMVPQLARTKFLRPPYFYLLRFCHMSRGRLNKATMATLILMLLIARA